MEHVPNIFFRSDKHPNLDWFIWTIWNTIVQKISEACLRTEAFSHIGFEAKQEMKPYYKIVHKTFQAAILRKLR